MRAVIVVVLAATTIASAQITNSARAGDGSLESRQGIAESSLTLPTLPLFQSPFQQFPSSGQGLLSPSLQLQLPFPAGLQALGSQRQQIPIGQALSGQLSGPPYGLRGNGLGPQIQGLEQGLGQQGLRQGLLGLQLRRLGQVLPGARLQGLEPVFPNPQQLGLGGSLPLAQPPNYGIQGLAGLPGGLSRLGGLGNGLTGLGNGLGNLGNGLGGVGGNSFPGLGGQEQGNQFPGLDVHPILGRRISQQESLAELLQLANILGESDPHSGFSTSHAKGHDRFATNRFAPANDDTEDDELTLLLQTLGALRSLPPTSSSPGSQGLAPGVFPGVPHRATGLGHSTGSGTGAGNRRVNDRALADQYYSQPGSGDRDRQDQFRFPSTI